MAKAVKVLYITLVSVLAFATLAEWRCGSPLVGKYVYSHWWLALLMALLSALGICLAIRKLARCNKPALMLHVSLAIIALGALVTRIFSVSGSLHLRQDAAEYCFVSDGGLMMRLPWPVTLRGFSVRCYPGTDTPMDYVSDIQLGDSLRANVSMNKVLSADGYRLYQQGYDPDLRGSTLMVSRDVLGMSISYLGYFMLFASLIWVLVNPSGRFRRIVSELTCACLIAALCGCSGGEEPAGPAPDAAMARDFDSVCCFHDGRIAPLDTYATDFCLKITGSRSFGGLSASQFMLGWLLYPDDWKAARAIKIKYPLPEGCSVGQDGGYTSLQDLFDSSGAFRLDMPGSGSLPKSVQDISDKAQLIISLLEGSEPRIFPANDGGAVRWLAASEADSGLIDSLQRHLAIHWTEMSRLALESGDREVWGLVPKAMLSIQQSNCGNSLPGPLRRRVEMAINRLAPVSWLYKIALAMGLGWLAACMLLIARGKPLCGLRKWLGISIISLAAMQAAALVARGYASQGLPVSSGYETMLLLALLVSLVGILALRMQELLGALSLLMSGFALLVAHLAISNPNITPLMPVLHSPWLSVHVVSVMIAYSLLSVVMLNGVCALILRRRLDASARSRFTKVSLALLYPAIVFLAIGIFVGAIWAGESWGTYWSWDPKEVWALITLLLYALPLHPSLCPRLQAYEYFHWYAIAAFLSVLMTYFGVNFLLGGMHSYAG